MKRHLFYSLVGLVALIGGIAIGYQSARAKPVRAAQPLYYIDPMHPAYRSEKPGVAPDCGMQLVPVYAGDVARVMNQARPSVVHVDADMQQMFGIQVAAVGRSPGHKTIRVLGRVSADETRIYRVNLGVDGLVKETRDDAVGTYVKKDQHLALIYSPEFLSVAGGFLSANEHSPGNAPKDNTAPTPNAASAQARADRLRTLGMSDAQIDEVSTTRKIPEDVYIVSPTDGFILSRNISPGLRFERHTELYRVADLSRVWVSAETFGNDADAFHPGAAARVTLPDTGEILTAHVSAALPEVDPVTHVMRSRLEVANPGFRLRPDMFVNVEMPIALSEGLIISSGAVLNAGLSKRVFVEVSPGDFEAREIQTGWESGDRVQITKGLHEGEKVVVAGTFLIDSESRMQRGVDVAESSKLSDVTR